MAVTLNPPVDETIEHQAITRFQVKVPHTIDSNGPSINKNSVEVVYWVSSYNLAGELINEKVQGVQFSEWPQVFIDDMKGVYAKLETDAQNRGLIYPGTGEILE